MADRMPNTIKLISPHGRYDEGPIGASDLYPGMLIQQAAGLWVPHAQAGGQNTRTVVLEDGLIGHTKLDKQPANDWARFWRCVSGDKMQMLIQKGQNIAKSTPLMSAGDGTLIANPGVTLYEVVAPSTTVTNTTTETTFSNSTYTIPANYLQVGDQIVIRGRATLTAHNGTDTHNVKVYIGSTLVASTGAVNIATNGVVEWALFLTIRTIGATGTFVASGYMLAGTPGTATPVGAVLSSTTIDTTATQQIKVTTTASAASAGNVIQLDEESVNNVRDAGQEIVCVADEARDNSGNTGTSLNNAMFIRVIMA